MDTSLSRLLSPTPRQPPRWWRSFIIASRRANIFRWLEIFCALSLLLAVGATWLTYSRATAPLLRR